MPRRCHETAPELPGACWASLRPREPESARRGAGSRRTKKTVRASSTCSCLSASPALVGRGAHSLTHSLTRAFSHSRRLLTHPLNESPGFGGFSPQDCGLRPEPAPTAPAPAPHLSYHPTNPLSAKSENFSFSLAATRLPRVFPGPAAKRGQNFPPPSTHIGLGQLVLPIPPEAVHRKKYSLGLSSSASVLQVSSHHVACCWPASVRPSTHFSTAGVAAPS